MTPLTRAALAIWRTVRDTATGAASWVLETRIDPRVCEWANQTHTDEKENDR